MRLTLDTRVQPMLGALAAAALDVAVRSVAPVPYAPTPGDIGISLALYGVSALPAVVLARLRRVAAVAAGVPFGVLVGALAFALGTKSRPTLAILSVAGWGAGVAATRLATARTLIAAASLCLLAALATRWGETARVADTTAPSVLLVVLDTTGAAHLPTYGYDRPISPNVTALARRSLVYRRALAAAPWTLPSHASIFSGRYPSELGFDGWNFDPERVTGSIAGDLAASGRRGWAVSANPILPGVFPLGAGFERVWGVEQLTHPVLLTVFDRLRHREGFQSRGSRVTALALDWLDRLSPRRRPWFLCLNYLDPHAPYRPPEVFAAGIDSERLSDFTQMYNTGRVPVTGELRAAMRDLYDGEIAAMDTAVGELLRGLERRGYDDSNLLVIVTADHGESLGDHGFVGHLLGMPDAVLRVPLLISGLGVEAGEVPTPVQVVQLRATIRALLGLEALPDIAPALPPWGQAPSLLIAEHPEPHWYFEELRGFKADLDAEPWRGNWVAAERDGLKVVFDDRGRGVTYDLRRDGGEAHPLPLSDGAEVVAAYRAWQNGAPATGTQVVSEEARRALEGLGYLR